MPSQQPESPRPLPKRFGKYRIIGTVGQGGMGVVYDAVHKTTRRRVALKTVRVSNRKMLKALRTEVHALRSVAHPCVVAVLDDGLSEPIPWYAMERIDGRSLAEFNGSLWGAPPNVRVSSTTAPSSSMELSIVPANELAERQRPASSPLRPPAANGRLHDALHIYRLLCESLIQVHALGIVHRDLKPGNVLLRRDDTPVLTDFGLAARSFGAGGRDALDIASRFIGSGPYVSPEQIRGALTDARADLYSFGCMLYETVTGRPPFSGATTQEVLEKHLQQTPVAPSLLVKDLPPELDRLITRLLVKPARDRMGHAADVLAVLLEVTPRPASYRCPTARHSRRLDYFYRPSIAGRLIALERIAALCDAASSGQGSFALIAGAAGIGKTFLAMEAARSAGLQKFQVITGECAAPSSADPGPPSRSGPLHVLRGLFQALADRRREGGAEGLSRLLATRGHALAAFEPSLLPFVRARSDRQARSSSYAASKQLFGVIADALRELASEQPLLLVLDDLQWADELTLAFLEFLPAEFITSTRLVLLGLCRSEGAGALLRRAQQQERPTLITLDRLSRAEVASMIRDMLALADPPAELVRSVHSHSGGNPFFVAEHLRWLATEGVIERRGGRWGLVAPAPARFGRSKPPSAGPPHPLLRDAS